MSQILPADMDDVICQRCQTINEFNIEQSGPHLKAICDHCGKYIKFIKQFNIHNQKLNTMSQGRGYWGSICIEDLFQGKIGTSQDGRQWVCLQDLEAGKPFTKSQNNGKHYIDIGLWVNESINEHGQIAALTLGQTKEMVAQGIKKVYIGNLKPNQVPQPGQTGYVAPQPQYGAPPMQGYPQQPPPQSAAGFAPVAGFTPGFVNPQQQAPSVQQQQPGYSQPGFSSPATPPTSGQLPF